MTDNNNLYIYMSDNNMSVLNDSIFHSSRNLAFCVSTLLKLDKIDLITYFKKIINLLFDFQYDNFSMWNSYIYTYNCSTQKNYRIMIYNIISYYNYISYIYIYIIIIRYYILYIIHISYIYYIIYIIYMYIIIIRYYIISSQ